MFREEAEAVQPSNLIGPCRKLFRKDAIYLGMARSASEVAKLNRDSPEIAFVGRSNCGKSSLLNALFHGVNVNKGNTKRKRKDAAFVSKQPGRTLMAQVFAVGENEAWKHRKSLPSFELVGVDLPGYGFAKVPDQVAHKMGTLIRNYVRNRSEYRGFLRLFLLVDARRGMTPLDGYMMDMLDAMGVLYQVVLTKCDATKSNELETNVSQVLKELAQPYRSASVPTVIGVSSKDNSIGVEQLQIEVMRLIMDHETPRAASLRNRNS